MSTGKATENTAGIVKQTVAVSDLTQTISDPPTKTEMDAIQDKINEILAAERTSGQIAT